MDADQLNRATEELERILQSPAFRTSLQSQRLLRHVVELSLSGRHDELRERVIGVALFGRKVGFDTTEDPIVRVRANEVRKRLARYYEQAAHPPSLRFEFHAGSYRVELLDAAHPGPPRSPSPAATEGESLPGPAPELPSQPHLHRRWHWWAAVSALAILSLVVSLSIGSLRPVSPMDDFWRPVLRSPGKVIVCTGHPVVYRFSRELLESRRPSGINFLDKQTEVLQFHPGEMVDAKDIVPIQDQYIGLGSAHAMARVSSWLAHRGASVDLRFGDDLSFTELKQAPAVLVSFANRWTIDFMAAFRFGPELVDGKSLIRDRHTGESWVLPNLQENGRTDEDYVLISRTFASDSGQYLIAIAGLTQYGTQAAGEIVTDPSILESALQAAGPGWQNHNLQLLFHVRVVDHTPGPPRLIATHQW